MRNFSTNTLILLPAVLLALLPIGLILVYNRIKCKHVKVEGC